MYRFRWIAILEVTLAVIAWGASFVATKVAVNQASPVSVVWLRFAIGVLILGFVMVWRKQFALPAWKDLGYLALLGFLGITFHQWLQSTGLVTSQATTTAWIVSTIPIFMALFGWFFLNEKMVWWQVLGIFVAVIGVLVVVSKGDLASLVHGGVGTRGDFLVMLSAPNWAVFSILSRRGLRQYPATWMMFYVMGFGWLFSTILLLFTGGFGSLSALKIDGWLGIAFLGLFCSGLAYIFWYDALKVLSSAEAGAFIYLEPIVTVLVAAFVIPEPLQTPAILGGIVILVGVWIVNHPTRRNGNVNRT